VTVQARVPDRRGKDRGCRRITVLRCTRLKDWRHCSGILLFRRICTTETASVQPGHSRSGARHDETGYGSGLRRRSANAVGNQFPRGTLSDRCRLVRRPSPTRTEMSEKRRVRSFARPRVNPSTTLPGRFARSGNQKILASRALIHPAFRPCAARRNTWLRTGRGSPAEHLDVGSRMPGA
jgi:hypothetical protein